MYSDPFYRITHLIKEEIRKYKWIEGEKGRKLSWERARQEWPNAITIQANTPRPKSLLRCHCRDPLRKIAKPTIVLSPTNRKAGSRLQDQAGALFFESHSGGALRRLRKWRCP